MTTQTIEREAKLFEAGNYPDREIEVTEEDLDKIIANTIEAPVRIEHTATPFDGAIGMLKSVYRRGKELFGKLCFTPAAWELIQAAGAKRLSVAIKKDKSGIAEVSLVREPRIADAAVFSADDVVQVGDAEFNLDPATVENPEVARLKQELADKEAQSIIDDLKRQGKLVPSSEIFARVILRSGDDSLITFGDQPTPVSQIFRWFLDAQPKVIEFSEIAPGESEEDEPEIFARLGITSRRVEKYRGR